ncbi:M20/M25/M40 family metallo-hydrolase [Saccharibacillus sp. CPCC 101409]|uniref:M20/M25/M40 family metallo-hydrolase n=1 Tax=Saccharibacillus sp. CPCC 101409 TaxID=3058041 RepID=UPI002671804E|nr:M20/M25/M40 family metallo-hydrolase [Saccharibacillus sp. CPCC 101409]MDO3409568.1 M20/M25/M40 family metallo-hydrolase [Saccharibacillus sp. CPCC 101409]
MIDKQRLIHEFLELVRIDSETKNERLIADVLTNKFKLHGLEVTEDDSASRSGHGAGNLIALLPAVGNTDAPKLFFTCHMDTVLPGRGVDPVIGEDGWITSAGDTILGADDKAGVAALFELIRVLRETEIPHGQIQFVITAGEESGLMGARAMDASLLDAELGYAVDSNGEIGAIAVSAPTQAKISMEIHGKSAHAGVNPEDGISAIQVAGKAIARMKLGRIDKDTTANIGSFAGGGATNVVTDHVKLEAEARSVVMEKVEAQIASMKEALEAACAEYGAKPVFQSRIAYPSFNHTDDSEVVRLAKKAASGLGLSGRTFQSGGGSDANVFNGFGVPTVNLSVGYENIHTTEERIRVDDLAKLAEFIVEIVRQSVRG